MAEIRQHDSKTATASMRPPEFTAETQASVVNNLLGLPASMRPPEFTGGNLFNPTLLCFRYSTLQ